MGTKRLAERFAWGSGQETRGKREIRGGIRMSGLSNWMKSAFVEVKETEKYFWVFRMWLSLRCLCSFVWRCQIGS